MEALLVEEDKSSLLDMAKESSWMLQSKWDMVECKESLLGEEALAKGELKAIEVCMFMEDTERVHKSTADTIADATTLFPGGNRH